MYLHGAIHGGCEWVSEFNGLYDSFPNCGLISSNLREMFKGHAIMAQKCVTMEKNGTIDVKFTFMVPDYHAVGTGPTTAAAEKDLIRDYESLVFDQFRFRESD